MIPIEYPTFLPSETPSSKPSNNPTFNPTFIPTFSNVVELEGNYNRSNDSDIDSVWLTIELLNNKYKSDELVNNSDKQAWKDLISSLKISSQVVVYTISSVTDVAFDLIDLKSINSNNTNTDADAMQIDFNVSFISNNAMNDWIYSINYIIDETTSMLSSMDLWNDTNVAISLVNVSIMDMNNYDSNFNYSNTNDNCDCENNISDDKCEEVLLLSFCLGVIVCFLLCFITLLFYLRKRQLKLFNEMEYQKSQLVATIEDHENNKKRMNPPKSVIEMKNLPSLRSNSPGFSQSNDRLSVNHNVNIKHVADTRDNFEVGETDDDNSTENSNDSIKITGNDQSDENTHEEMYDVVNVTKTNSPSPR